MERDVVSVMSSIREPADAAHVRVLQRAPSAPVAVNTEVSWFPILTWPAEPFLSTLQEVNFCQASNISSCWLQFLASCRINTPRKKL